MTNEEWDALTPKGRWDIMVAQRGPDCLHSDTLKWFTTSVIRAQVSKVLRAWGGSALINSDLSAIILPNSRIAAKSGSSGMASFDYSHFLDHIYQAAMHLHLPVGIIRADTWHEAMLLGEKTGNLATVADKLLSGLSAEELDQQPAFKELKRHRDQYLVKRYAGWSDPPPMPTLDLSALLNKKAKTKKQEKGVTGENL